jgi:hypothetical protein
MFRRRVAPESEYVARARANLAILDELIACAREQVRLGEELFEVRRNAYLTMAKLPTSLEALRELYASPGVVDVERARTARERTRDVLACVDGDGVDMGQSTTIEAVSGS